MSEEIRFINSCGIMGRCPIGAGPEGEVVIVKWRNDSPVPVVITGLEHHASGGRWCPLTMPVSRLEVAAGSELAFNMTRRVGTWNQ